LVPGRRSRPCATKLSACDGCGVNILDVLDGHVALEVDCVDRLNVNACVPGLQVPG
jgi:hypothetical protein